MKHAITSTPCPCGSGKSLADCCGPLLAKKQQAPTAEALMRSRYTAYTLGKTEYILETWHPKTRPQTVAAADIPPWRNLTIRNVWQGREKDETGTVEFIASAMVGAEPFILHETSSFIRENGQWFYLDGEVADMKEKILKKTGKVGRNAPCPCGSGKKFKKCCGH